ncbi:Low affinity sulfate transporter 3 [Glycine max]|nr:Low affinity sulfate transporter 3 [Glycine max]
MQVALVDFASFFYRHVAVVSLLLSSLVPKLVDPAVDPDAYRNVVSTVTLFAGIFQAAFGIFRLGFLVDFLSHAALVGFMAGATIMIGFSFRSVHQETLITNNYVMRIGAATPRKSSSHQQGDYIWNGQRVMLTADLGVRLEDIKHCLGGTIIVVLESENKTYTRNPSWTYKVRPRDLGKMFSI